MYEFSTVCNALIASRNIFHMFKSFAQTGNPVAYLKKKHKPYRMQKEPFVNLEETLRDRVY